MRIKFIPAITLVLVFLCLSAGKAKKRDMAVYLKEKCHHHDLKVLDILKLKKEKHPLQPMEDADRFKLLAKINLPATTKVNYLSTYHIQPGYHWVSVFLPMNNVSKVYLLAFDNDGNIVFAKALTETMYEPSFKFYSHSKFVDHHNILFTQIFYKGKYKEKGAVMDVDSTSLQYTIQPNTSIRETLISQYKYKKKLP